MKINTRGLLMLQLVEKDTNKRRYKDRQLLDKFFNPINKRLKTLKKNIRPVTTNILYTKRL